MLFHGLEGSSDSHYARMLMATLAARGWRGVIPHFRGCSGEPNRLPRAYHSGDHEELGGDARGHRERASRRATVVYAVGVSVGGSVLLNWLGRRRERRRACRRRGGGGVDAARPRRAPASRSARASTGSTRSNFLSTLKPKSLAMAQRFPGLLDDARIRRVRTMYDFDDVVTSLLHGFAGATDYWRRASSKPWLASVAVPTLVLNARNDPFVPAESLPGVQRRQPRRPVAAAGARRSRRAS